MIKDASIPDGFPDPLPAADGVIAATVVWLEKAVIGLNLCPFAKAVQRKQQVRYAVSGATTQEALSLQLEEELRFLHGCDPQRTDTTLLIHPGVLQDFVEYNAYLPLAQRILKRLGLRGEIQIASFHPAYEFVDSAPDAIENFSNRSPYPMLHLLREASIERALASFPDADAIFARNIDTLRTLGHAGWRALGIGPDLDGGQS